MSRRDPRCWSARASSSACMQNFLAGQRRAQGRVHVGGVHGLACERSSTLNGSAPTPRPRHAQFVIYRYDPERDDKPRMQTWRWTSLPATVLLLIAPIRLEGRPTRARVAAPAPRGRVRLRDAMNINGKNGPACITNMRSLPQTIVPAAARPAGDPRPTADYDRVLQAVPLDRALPRQRRAAA